MKSTLSLTLGLVIILLTACTKQLAHEEKALKRIQNKWLTDHRTAIFNVEIIARGSNVVLKGETTLPLAKEDLLLAIKQREVNVIDSISVLPEKKLFKQWAITTLSNANLRDEPKHAAQLVTQTTLGTPVKVLKQNEDWSLVQSPDQYIAWTNNSSLHFVNDSELSHWKTSTRAIMMQDSWMCHENGERIADLLAGSIVRLNGQNGTMSHVALPDGRSGYVKSQYIREFSEWIESVDVKGENLLKTAKQFMGLPYLWGGTSTKAVDCSGFVKTVYFLNGYVLARDASQQINYGEAIDLNVAQLKAGDLLFFGQETPRKVTHVGMYIGDTEYIHSSGRVKINSLDTSRENYNDYRSSTWLGAQRYIGQASSKGIIPIKAHPWYVQLKMND